MSTTNRSDHANFGNDVRQARLNQRNRHGPGQRRRAVGPSRPIPNRLSEPNSAYRSPRHPASGGSTSGGPATGDPASAGFSSGGGSVPGSGFTNPVRASADARGGHFAPPDVLTDVTSMAMEVLGNDPGQPLSLNAFNSSKGGGPQSNVMTRMPMVNDAFLAITNSGEGAAWLLRHTQASTRTANVGLLAFPIPQDARRRWPISERRAVDGRSLAGLFQTGRAGIEPKVEDIAMPDAVEASEPVTGIRQELESTQRALQDEPVDRYNTMIHQYARHQKEMDEQKASFQKEMDTLKVRHQKEMDEQKANLQREMDQHMANHQMETDRLSANCRNLEEKNSSSLSAINDLEVFLSGLQLRLDEAEKDKEEARRSLSQSKAEASQLVSQHERQTAKVKDELDVLFSQSSDLTLRSSRISAETESLRSQLTEANQLRADALSHASRMDEARQRLESNPLSRHFAKVAEQTVDLHIAGPAEHVALRTLKLLQDAEGCQSLRELLQEGDLGVLYCLEHVRYWGADARRAFQPQGCPRHRHACQLVSVVEDGGKRTLVLPEIR
ncbi:hypothetical protein EDB81DRAFT_230966 [Dactylonectria macrodidyma]|uniref:Uncharacterized protein n=1 Tax=Dactylonectria macrodidyma TaxID=307937 RepID=A0A9P9DMF7_9HYPO|nr:hypothetical protein EDB81DRAFT_230966 [Dactylonectria macrodidyma]